MDAGEWIPLCNDCAVVLILQVEGEHGAVEVEVGEQARKQLKYLNNPITDFFRRRAQ